VENDSPDLVVIHHLRFKCFCRSELLLAGICRRKRSHKRHCEHNPVCRQHLHSVHGGSTPPRPAAAFPLARPNCGLHSSMVLPIVQPQHAVQGRPSKAAPAGALQDCSWWQVSSMQDAAVEAGSPAVARSVAASVPQSDPSGRRQPSIRIREGGGAREPCKMQCKLRALGAPRRHAARCEAT
jgi:hypothetical protein